MGKHKNDGNRPFDERLIEAAAAGLVPLSDGDEPTLVVAPRHAAARRLLQLTGGAPELSQRFHIACLFKWLDPQAARSSVAYESYIREQSAVAKGQSVPARNVLEYNIVQPHSFVHEERPAQLQLFKVTVSDYILLARVIERPEDKLVNFAAFKTEMITAG